MILIIDLSSNALGYEEFVRPVTDLLEKDNFIVLPYSEVTEEETKKYDKIILCGTALQDNEYQNNTDKFSWLKNTDKKVLGICAGAQVIAKVFGGDIIENKEIGVKSIEIFENDILTLEKDEVYELHNYSITLPEDFILAARTEDCIQAIKYKDILGVLFHPEVMNKELIKQF